MKRFFLLLLSVVAATGLHAKKLPLVAVTTYPLYEAVQRVGGGTVELYKVLPFGNDIHTFRPSPKTMVSVSRADLFIYSGAGLEPWSEQLLTNLPERTKVVDMSHYVALLGHDDDEDHEADGEHEAHGGHEHGGVDPHYWLDIDNMIALTRQVQVLLSVLQPGYREAYRSNAVAFESELEALKTEYRKRLTECSQHHLVSNHDAFGYLAHAYGFETIAVTGLSPDQQPSAKTMARVIRLIEDEKISTLFFEAFVSSSVAEALAAETGARVDSLQPLANLSADEAASHETYITIMRKNLEKIARALECP